MTIINDKSTKLRPNANRSLQRGQSVPTRMTEPKSFISRVLKSFHKDSAAADDNHHSAHHNGAKSSSKTSSHKNLSKLAAANKKHSLSKSSVGLNVVSSLPVSKPGLDRQPLSIREIANLSSSTATVNNADNLPYCISKVYTTTAKNGIEVKTVSASVGIKGTYFMKEISYTNEKIIGNGSFGVVYQATLVEKNEVVAIKRVLQDRRFKNRELNIMVSLDHCNIVRLKYYFYTYKNPKEDIYLNLVLEFIPDTVSKVARFYMRQGQKMPMIYIKLYMYQLFRSLAYIHALGICHRDIKPQNLLVNPMTGVLKLCDFGSAKHLVRGEMNVSYICSRYYRAPELIFGATDYTTKIDIWSAGCVFAELLLGYPIFSGESGVDQLVEIIKVLGTPSKEQIRRMNRHYTEFKFPKISANPWEKVFGARTPPEVIDLVSRLLDYTPFMRFDPLKACTHQFFDDLRNPTCKLPNDRELPPLFNFRSQELKIAPELNAVLIPPHLHSQFSQYLTHSQEQLDSSIDPNDPAAVAVAAAAAAASASSSSIEVSNPQDPKPSTSSACGPAGAAAAVPTAGVLSQQQQHISSSSPSSHLSHNTHFSLSPKQQQHVTSSSLDTKSDLDSAGSGIACSNSSMQSTGNNTEDTSSTISTETVTTASAVVPSSVVTN